MRLNVYLMLKKWRKKNVGCSNWRGEELLLPLASSFIPHSHRHVEGLKVEFKYDNDLMYTSVDLNSLLPGAVKDKTKLEFSYKPKQPKAVYFCKKLYDAVDFIQGCLICQNCWFEQNKTDNKDVWCLTSYLILMQMLSNVIFDACIYPVSLMKLHRFMFWYIQQSIGIGILALV